MIYQLPDVVIALMFDCLPLPELIKIGQTCKRFGYLRNIALKRRHNIKIISGKMPPEQMKHSIFEFDSTVDANNNDGSYEFFPTFVSNNEVRILQLARRNVMKLVNILPNIKSLEICINRAHFMQITQIIYLLRNWGEQLTHLEISLNLEPDVTNYHFEVRSNLYRRSYMWLIRAVNDNCPNLTRLSLNIKHKFNDLLDFPILSQLKEFRFFSYNSSTVVLHSLQKYIKPNSPLQSIALESGLDGNNIGRDHFLNLDKHITDRFVQLDFFIDDNPLRQPIGTELVKTFFVKYPNLMLLRGISDGAPFSHIRYPTILNLVSTLKNLIHLDLTLEQLPYRRKEVQQNATSTLPSVRTLNLKLRANSHSYLTWLDIQRLFPNLQLIKVYYIFEYSCHFPYVLYKCNKCKTRSKVILDNDELLDKFIRCFLKPLKECAKLQKIGFVQCKAFSFSNTNYDAPKIFPEIKYYRKCDL